MPRLTATLTACALLLLAGAVHGLWTARWQASEELQAAAARVPAVPLELGDWRGTPLEADPAPYAQAGAVAWWLRGYRDDKTGASVSAILMCGPAGPLSVHTPDVCYRGAGYRQEGASRRQTVDVAGLAEPVDFWEGTFTRDSPALDGRLRLLWLWGCDGRWQAPDNPRFAFRGRPALYKLYVIHDGAGGPDPAAPDPAVGFLRELLPALGKTLFSPGPP